MRLVDVATGQELHTLTGDRTDSPDWGPSVGSIAFSPDGRFVAAGSGFPLYLYHAGAVKVWDVAAAREVASFTGLGGGVPGLAFSPDGRTLAAAIQRSPVRLWEVGTWREVRGLAHPGCDALAFAPDGRTLATGGVDHTIRLWDAASRHELALLRGHKAWVSSVVFSPDGTRLASAGGDRTVRVWDLATGQQQTSYPHPGPVFAVAYSPDGKLLAFSAQREGRDILYVMDVERRKTIKRFDVGLEWVTSPSWSPDGKQIVVSGSKTGLTDLFVIDYEQASHRKNKL